MEARPTPDPAPSVESPPGRKGRRRAVLRAVRDALAAAFDWFPQGAPNRSVLVGFSGGVDSTALLHLLAAPGGLCARTGGPGLLAAHLDHQLRPDSAEQARFAKAVATSLGIPFLSARCDVGARSRQEGRSLEEAGRLARLDFFADVAREQRVPEVLLGHTLTDQAETVLLQLARGAGTLGLGAMAPVRNDERGLVVVRPLLAVSRAHLARVVKEAGWPVYADPSNQLEEFTRNRIRRQALPVLRETVNPQVEAALGRTASLLRDDEEWLRELTSRRFAEIAEVRKRRTGAEVRFGVRELAAGHPALQRRLVRQGLRTARGNLRRIGAVHIEAVLRLVAGGRGGSSLNLPAAEVRLKDRVLTISPTGTGEADGVETQPGRIDPGAAERNL